MDYRELREVMKFLHCKGLMAKDIYADMLDTLGDSAPSYAMVKKWVTEFRRGRTSTEDLIRSGRPRDVSTYENVDYIRNLIKDDERVTVQDIAKYVGISFGSVHAILSKLLELVKVSGRWVPRRVSNDRRMTRMEFCKEIGSWYRVNPSRLVQQTVIDDAWIYHFERTEIFSQPPGTDAENGDEPPEQGILNKVLTGELKRPKIIETPSNVVDSVKDTVQTSDSSNGVKSDEVSGAIKPKLDENDDLVTSNSGDSEVKPEEIENEPDSTVQDGKVDSTDEKLVVAIKDDVKDEVKATNGGTSENGSDKVDSTENLSKDEGKVTNGASSAVPNILAILGQKPVNGRPAQGASSYIPIMGPHGLTLGHLSGNQFASILAGANMTQLASLAGVNPGLLNGANLAQLAGVGNLAQLGILAQAQQASGGNANMSLVGQKRPAPELTPLPKKKQRSGRPSSATSCVFWDSGGVILVETLEPGQKLTGEVYCGMLNRLKEAMDVKRPGALDRGVLLVEDQAPEGARPPRGLQLLPLPVNSPDLTPSDFHIFPKVKEHLRGRQKTGFVSAIEAYLKAQEDGYFKCALTEMERRCTLCVDLNGDYVENGNALLAFSYTCRQVMMSDPPPHYFVLHFASDDRAEGSTSQPTSNDLTVFRGLMESAVAHLALTEEMVLRQPECQQLQHLQQTQQNRMSGQESPLHPAVSGYSFGSNFPQTLQAKGILKKVFSDLPDLSAHIPIDLLEDSLGEFTAPILGLGSNVSFITSNRGKELLLYQGFKFGLHRRLACGGTSWSCCTRACPARLRCIGDSYTVTKARVDHNHPPPKPEKLERQKVYNAAKRKALETMSERPSNVISAVLSEETVDQLSKDDLARIRKNLHRARREHNKRLLKVFTDDLETNLSSILNPRTQRSSKPANLRGSRSRLQVHLEVVGENSQETEIKTEIKEEELSILPSSDGLAKVVLEEFIYVPAEDVQEVRLLVKNHEFTKESYVPGDMRWRCMNEHCQAKFVFIESETTFTDVCLDHNHPPPDLKSLNLRNACTMKLSSPVVTLEQCEFYGSEDITHSGPLPLDPYWVWDGPEPLRQPAHDGHPPLPATNQHCPVCLTKRHKFDAWKCGGCTSALKAWRDKQRYAVPRPLPRCYHSLYQPMFNCNGCRRRRMQWEWARRQTRPLGIPMIQY
ncbi:hypothetical protein GE061_002984 [Apolygus lucorum]|uniref:FLYWCH-type domain-containing protein n=1 Tax=Apolygus lucorum TaxID=248454 RepID=A0A8S9X3C3_APOLU|nr:hypothetical protein GE061_002984 [Apolygus lucorum]